MRCEWALAWAKGPCGRRSERAVWFVDIKGRCIHRYDEASAHRRTSWQAPEDVGFIVAATRRALHLRPEKRPASVRTEDGSFQLIAAVDSDRPRNRLNDAHVDAAGRLWFGTMDDDEASPTGALYRFDARGLQRCDDGYVITNGPATSPDGQTLYHIDTLERVIYAFDLAADGSLSARRVFARVAESDGYPDGPAVDADRMRVGRSVRRLGREPLFAAGEAAEQTVVAGGELHQAGVRRRRSPNAVRHERVEGTRG